MFLSVGNDDFGILYDANGQEIQNAVEADTETGIVVVIRTDENGKPVPDESGEFIDYERIRCKAPLTFRRFKPEEMEKDIEKMKCPYCNYVIRDMPNHLKKSGYCHSKHKKKLGLEMMQCLNAQIGKENKK